MVEDVSRTTIFVLVVLTLLISVLGTWTVVNQLSFAPVSRVAPAPPASGEVGFTVQRPPPPVTATGKVVFRIVEG